MIKSLTVILISTFVLLLPTHGSVHEGGLYTLKPKLVKPLADTPLKPVEALATVSTAPAVTYAGSGDCATWLAQAGIPVTYGVMELINGESGCRPDAVNPLSGACGIPQALPCSKMGCALTVDPVCQLKWMQSYVLGSYGSWENALAQWAARSPHWY